VNGSLCVIPARGGSERLPGKNIKLMAGKPMIAWTIECARSCGLFSAVYVSTDDEEIAKAAREYGALTPAPLPAEIARPDQASMRACVFMHEYLRSQGHGPWEFLFCLQPTSPLRAPEDILAAEEKMRTGDYEHVVSCTAIDPHYHHWAMKEAGGYLSPVFGPEYQVDRLYLPEVLRPNGAVKVMRTGFAGVHETFFDSRKVGAVKMPEERSVHVAHEIDFALAELLLTRRERKRDAA